MLQGWVEAAEQLRAFSASCLCPIHLEQLQLEALYAVRRDLKAGAISAAAARQRLERSPYWVWTAMDPQRKRLVVVEVGPRPLAMAARVGPQSTAGLAPGCGPRGLTDGLKDCATALLTPVGQGMPPERRQERGPMPQPRWLPVPALLYAQGVKSYRRRRLVGVPHRVVVGPRGAIAQSLAPGGWTIKTAVVARLPRDIRQRVAAIGRRVPTLCQGEAGLRDQLGLFPG